jgi:uncharacterized protein (TIGR03083 family)
VSPRPARSQLAPEIASARASLVSTLRNLPDEDWDAQSLCGDWAIRDVVGHLVHEYKVYKAPYGLVRFLRFGFRVNRYISAEARRIAAARSASELTSALEASRFENTLVWRRFQYPFYALSEFVIHAQDIRRPLGIPDKPSIAQLRIVADIFLRPPRTNPFAGIFMTKLPATRFEATDTDWSHGDGPVARGPLEAIAMVIAGRGQAIDDLSGEGVDPLRAKLSA